MLDTQVVLLSLVAVFLLLSPVVTSAGAPEKRAGGCEDECDDYAYTKYQKCIRKGIKTPEECLTRFENQKRKCIKANCL
jgi:hypothetical protein